MQISPKDVQHLADLSNISMSAAEASRLQTDLESILKYIDQLSELDTEGVEPTYQVTGLSNVTRPDEIIKYPADRAALLGLSREVADYQIKVPKIL